jgi:hypothetical protein
VDGNFHRFVLVVKKGLLVEVLKPPFFFGKAFYPSKYRCVGRLGETLFTVSSFSKNHVVFKSSCNVHLHFASTKTAT